jgi:hypothetical protein
VVAHRRGVLRPCTPAGHYTLDSWDPSPSGDAFEASVRDALLDYLAIFLIDGTATLLFGDEPRQVMLTYRDSDTGPSFSGTLEDDLRLSDEGPVYDLTIDFTDGKIDLAEDGASSISASVSIAVTGGDLDAAFSLEVDVGGTRQ